MKRCASCLLCASFLLTAPIAGAQTTDPCDLVNGTSVVGNKVTLLEDLDCTDVPFLTLPWAIVLVNGGELDLNGFTLKANSAVRCDHEAKPCTIMSSVPGGTLRGTLPAPPLNPVFDDGIAGDAGVRVVGVTITGFAGDGIVAAAHPGQRITLVGATVTANGGTGVLGGAQLFGAIVSDNGFGGVTSAAKTTIVEDSEITGNGTFGIAAAQKLKMNGATVGGNGSDGIRLIRASYELGSQRAVLTDSTIAGNGGDGLRATDRIDARVSLRSTTVSGNAANGVANVGLVKARESTFESNGASGIETSSVDGCRVSLTNTTVGGNGVFGVALGFPAQPCSGGRFKATASTLTASGSDPDCYVTQPCGDVASSTMPVLVASSACDRSYVLGSGLPGSSWSVCTLD